MNEKTFKMLGQIGSAGIAAGILCIMSGVCLGIIMIVSGARALSAKRDIMI
ncbi:MAG: hypothetical protein LUF92_08230 [Clostridiales bacterium]|nr:hypothetical protein [Clostridiales bacterium]